MINRILRSLYHWREMADTADQLSRLSDDQLRDIGLSRGDIPAVLRQMNEAH
ncbi:DUF1127 domain-containing protein [Acuticoccus mangrovi]|uniref:DUF1127 domain-containing protein n=1 Tax=Acuticoccus mangrovi TaxID=2796142 RepID=A0A934IHS4_9HYPH|nr:DUF1127 domain-containing protein [Acuticoccus mangrovi]MBJ3775231.1 DUF1127 domain-containing protein [Acuticoccus mangrovi]